MGELFPVPLSLPLITLPPKFPIMSLVLFVVFSHTNETGASPSSNSSSNSTSSTSFSQSPEIRGPACTRIWIDLTFCNGRELGFLPHGEIRVSA